MKFKKWFFGLKDIFTKPKCLIAIGIELAIVGVLIVADLLTKKYIYGALPYSGRIVINGFLRFVPVENTGASFGIFSDSTKALSIVSLVTSVALFIFMVLSVRCRNLWLRSSLILILSGGIGNLIDRLALGYVRDFIDFYFINFAVFNFADSCLTVGTIVLCIYVIFFYKPDKNDKDGHCKEGASE